MAEELWKDIAPHLQPGFKLTFAGHSMGGSLAMLLTCLARLRLQLPASRLRCFTYGAPPVLSLLTSSGCTSITQECLAPCPLEQRVWLRQRRQPASQSTCHAHQLCRALLHKSDLLQCFGDARPMLRKPDLNHCGCRQWGWSRTA